MRSAFLLEVHFAKLIKSRCSEAKADGEHGWNRTNDHLIKSQVLYRLSYVLVCSSAFERQRCYAAEFSSVIYLSIHSLIESLRA